MSVRSIWSSADVRVLILVICIGVLEVFERFNDIDVIPEVTFSESARRGQSRRVRFGRKARDPGGFITRREQIQTLNYSCLWKPVPSNLDRHLLNLINNTHQAIRPLRFENIAVPASDRNHIGKNGSFRPDNLPW